MKLSRRSIPLHFGNFVPSVARYNDGSGAIGKNELPTDSTAGFGFDGAVVVVELDAVVVFVVVVELVVVVAFVVGLEVVEVLVVVVVEVVVRALVVVRIVVVVDF